MSLPLLLALLCVVSVCAGSPLLYALPGVDHEHAVALLGQGVDVRGSYGQSEIFTLALFANQSSLPKSTHVLIGELATDHEVLILEEVKDSAVLMSQCSKILDGMFCRQDACVFVVSPGMHGSLGGCLTPEVNLVTMPPRAISPPRAFAPPQQQGSSVRSIPIPDLLPLVSLQTLSENLITLTNFHTRQSQSTQAVQAAGFLQGEFSKFGWNATQIPFRTGFSSNVIAEIKGNVDPSKIIIVGAHYDSRAANVNSPTDRAPGANDDGSGTAVLLELARIFGTQPSARLPVTLQLAAFSGEEQGLIGSTAYANSLKDRGANVIAMIQADMVAMNPTSDLRISLVTRATTPELTAAIDAVIRKYLPQVVVGRSTACCSDQQPFFNNGFPAAFLLESASDPDYHKVTDVINRPNYSVELIRATAQIAIASVATLATE